MLCDFSISCAWSMQPTPHCEDSFLLLKTLESHWKTEHVFLVSSQPV